MTKEDVEEVVSDSFLCLWNVSDTLQEDKPLTPYIAAITRNISKNRLRKISKNISIDDYMEYSSFETPEHDFEISEQTEKYLSDFTIMVKSLKLFPPDSKSRFQIVKPSFAECVKR